MSERDQLEKAIAAMEAQRAALGDEVVRTAIAAFRTRIEALDASGLGEERRVVTILFVELAGLLERMGSADAEDLHERIAPLWEQLDALVVENGGMVEKHSRFTLMALFGVPSAHENDPERAAWAALAMMHDPTPEGHPPISLRIGIHTGPVMVGAVDSTGEMSALGDAVNLASRLKDAAGENEILVSQDTFRHIRGIFDLQTLEPLPLRGKSEPVQVYRLRSARTRALRLTSSNLASETTALVGHIAELETLQNLYLMCLQESSIRMVSIGGETGIGKTRLAQEFVTWLSRQGHSPRSTPLCLQTSTPLEKSHTPFALLRSLLSGYYQIDDTLSAEKVRTRLERELRPLLRGDSIEGAHLIGHLAGYDFSSSPYVQRYRENATALRQRAFHLFGKFFAALAAGRPLVIIADDMQWADPDSLAMIDALIQEEIHFPLFLLFLARPQFFDDYTKENTGSAERIQKWSAHTHLELGPLTPIEVRRLGSALLQPKGASQETPEVLLDALQERANGNPFFISEIIHMWFEDSTLLPTQEGWKLNPEMLQNEPRSLWNKIPANLVEVMQARLDSLPIPERDLIKRAAVIGRIFWDQALQALAPHTSEDINVILHQLISRGLVIEHLPSRFADCKEYSFTHSLLYQVTYESILKRLRPSFHVRAAEWLEEQARRTGDEAYSVNIAEHYEKASQFALAALWYERAGDVAVRRFQPEIALNCFQKSLLFLPPAEVNQRIGLLRKIGDVLMWMARYNQALDLAAVQAETAQTHHQPGAWADSLNRMSAIQNRLGGHTQGLMYTAQAEAIARQANAQAELAAALYYRGISLYRMGNGNEAQSVAEQALELNTRLKKEEGFPNAQAEIVRCLNLLGMVHQFKGNYSASRDYYQQVLDYHRATGNPSGAIAALNNLGVVAHIRGDYSTAVNYYRQALEEARYIGYKDLEWLCASNLSGAMTETGEYQHAESYLRKVLEETRDIDWFLSSEAKRFLAAALLKQRHRQEALEYAREALETARKNGAREFMGRTWRVLGQIAAQSPSGRIQLPDEAGSKDNPQDWKEYSAADCFRAGEAVFQQSGGAGELARTWREWARYELKFGDADLGRSLWSKARASFEAIGMEIEVQRMQQEMPEL